MKNRKLFYKPSWDRRLEDWIDENPFLAAMIAAPFLYGLLVLLMLI